MPELANNQSGDEDIQAGDYNVTVSSARTLKSTNNRFTNLREIQLNFMTRVDLAKEYFTEHFEGTGDAAAKTKEAI
jgi:hypothetical protein